MNNDDVWNGNNIDSIDKKITQSAKDDLDALEDTLDHIDEIGDEEFSNLQSKANEMVDDCSKDDLKKVIKLLIKIARKSFEDE